MLLLAKGYNKSQENLRKGKLFSPRGLTIWKKRVCIVGLGNVGMTLAKRLSSFDVAMVGVNRSWKDIFSSLSLERFYTMDKLSDAVRGCRFVVITVALTPQTKGLIGEKVLGSMDENAFLINVARADCGMRLGRLLAGTSESGGSFVKYAKCLRYPAHRGNQ
jgi:phosphoglycerate dehydrogenase-like enzyme